MHYNGDEADVELVQMYYESDLRLEWLWQIEGHVEDLNLIFSPVMISLSLL